MTDKRTGNKNSVKRVSKNSEGPWRSWKGLTRHGRAIKFIETYCSPPKGVGFGQPMKLGKFQKEWLEEILASDVDAAVNSFPRGNGKSTFSAAIAVWGLFDDLDTGAPQIPVVATTVGQAIKSVYGVAESMVKRAEELDDRAIIYSGIGTKRIYVPFSEGEMFPISNDTDGLQGLDPSIALCDEIGFQPVETWTSLLLASGKRPQSLVMGFGTPGLDKENALWELRKRVKEGATINGFKYREYSATEGCSVFDKAQWRQANPALVEGFLAEKALQLALDTAPEAHFRVFRLGQWVDGVESWLGPNGREIWDSLRSNQLLVPGAPTWIGIDVGIKKDSTAVVAVQYDDDGKLIAQAWVWMPQKDQPVDVTDVMEHLRKLSKEYKVGAISYDPKFFDVPAKQLYDDGLPMVEIPQSVERMTPIIGNLYEAIMNRQILHNDDETFTTHVMNAVPRFNERGFTLQKQKSRGKIDACIALALAVDRALYKKKPRPPLLILRG